MAQTRLKAGVAEVDITPPIGTGLVAELAPRASEAVRLPLMARALVLSNGAVTLALVTLDLYGISPKASEELAARAAAVCGTRREAVMVICSGTRGGPATAPLVGCPQPDSALVDEAAARAVTAVDRAAIGMKEAFMGTGHAILPHLVWNHRLVTRNYKTVTAWLGIPKNEVLGPEGPTDPLFSVVTIRGDAGKPACFLWSFAADNRFPADTGISADLPGLVQKEVDARLGSHVPCLFLNGCAGNTSFAHGLAESADAAASAVIAVYRETSGESDIRLACRAEKMILPVRDHDQFWSRPDIELKMPAAAAAFAAEIQLMSREVMRAIPVTIRAFRLGRTAVAGMPGMPFVEHGLAVRQQSNFAETIVAGNCGGQVGPIPTRDAFAAGGYETWTARSACLGLGAGEFIAEEAQALLRELDENR